MRLAKLQYPTNVTEHNSRFNTYAFIIYTFLFILFFLPEIYLYYLYLLQDRED